MKTQTKESSATVGPNANQFIDDDDSQGSVKRISTQNDTLTAASTLPKFHPSSSNHENIDSSVRNEREDNESQQQQVGKKKKRNKKKGKKMASEMQQSETRSQDGSQNTAHSNADQGFIPLKDKVPDSFFDQQDSSEDEGMPDYKIGGYHPVHVGEILLDRYVIIQKLGWGHFSTVWLTKDLKFNSYVAIKVQKSAQHYLEAAYDEVEILDKVASNWRSKEWLGSIKNYYQKDPELLKSLNKYGISGDTSHCVQLLNSFIHNGPNGKHFIMVFEILGVNFLEIIKRYDYKGVPIPLVRKLARQCLIGLDYMHRQCKIIHTDFKPENVVIGLREDEVSEIKKTGQLTTTKMFVNSENIKQLITKVAGTAAPVQEKKAPTPAVPQKDGLTSKQKKNLKKKANRKRKKLETSRMSQQDDVEDDEEGEGETVEIDLDQVKIDTEKIVAEGKEFLKKKKHAITESLDRIGGRQEINGLLGDEEAKAQAKGTTENNKRGPRINEDVQVKICDMGNGCWTYHHFTPEIQTRQYRSPEVIVGADYNTSADVWSFACTIFEMITGDFLFEPRKGANYDKDDDHLAQMMELLGRMPKNLALSGKNSRKFFDSRGKLRRISGLNYWPLRKVLTDKYLIKEKEALALADFLNPMLKWHHDKRASAQEMLNHPWLNMPANYETRYTKMEFDILQLKKMKHGADASNDLQVDDPRQEMNELIESDPENYQPDSDDSDHLSNSRGGFNDDLSEQDFDKRSQQIENLFNSGQDEGSLQSEREHRMRLRSRKNREGKINNSFTGPYPLDPTEFNHNDKGANAQFLYDQTAAAKAENKNNK